MTPQQIDLVQLDNGLPNLDGRDDRRGLWRRGGGMIAHQRERLLVIGAGMAAARLCDELARRAPDRCDVTMVGAEPSAPYNRVLLSAALAGEIDDDELALDGAGWRSQANFRLLAGCPVAALDLNRRIARRADGRELAFDRVVFATGSSAVRLPIPGADLPGVATFRDHADLAALRQAARGRGRVAVIGGGLLGIEAAAALAKLGAAVTLVHRMDRLMERQLDARSASFLKRAVERRGVEVRLEVETVAVAGETRADGLVFADGGRLTADLVVIAVGVRPNVELARAAGLAVNRGIVVDQGLAASRSFVHAIGECAETAGQVCGLVEPAYEQVSVLARRLAGERDARYVPAPPATHLKVAGAPVFSAGEFDAADAEAITYEDRALGVSKRLTLRDNRLTGAVLVGETDDALWYRDLIRDGASVAAFRDDLIFGPAFCGRGERRPVQEAA
jgi:nitrite reductase (NADH) large subunit